MPISPSSAASSSAGPPAGFETTKACCAQPFSTTTRRPDRWSTFKALARANVADATPILLGAMGRGNKAAKTRAIAFGFQVVLGTLVNAILNDPGPLSIHDKEMEERLASCLLLLLQAEMTAAQANGPARHARKRRK